MKTEDIFNISLLAFDSYSHIPSADIEFLAMILMTICLVAYYFPRFGRLLLGEDDESVSFFPSTVYCLVAWPLSPVYSLSSCILHLAPFREFSRSRVYILAKPICLMWSLGSSSVYALFPRQLLVFRRSSFGTLCAC